MFQHVPSNTPIYTSQTPHRLFSKQDWGHVIEHKDWYVKADWNQKIVLQGITRKDGFTKNNLSQVKKL